jgi:hypothetical protein
LFAFVFAVVFRGQLTNRPMKLLLLLLLLLF